MKLNTYIAGSLDAPKPAFVIERRGGCIPALQPPGIDLDFRDSYLKSGSMIVSLPRPTICRLCGRYRRLASKW
jgi:hypothetical protein